MIKLGSQAIKCKNAPVFRDFDLVIVQHFDTAFFDFGYKAVKIYAAVGANKPAGYLFMISKAHVYGAVSVKFVKKIQKSFAVIDGGAHHIACRNQNIRFQ
jgi:hypothetical protein